MKTTFTKSNKTKQWFLYTLLTLFTASVSLHAAEPGSTNDKKWSFLYYLDGASEAHFHFFPVTEEMKVQKKVFALYTKDNNLHAFHFLSGKEWVECKPDDTTEITKVPKSYDEEALKTYFTDDTQPEDSTINMEFGELRTKVGDGNVGDDAATYTKLKAAFEAKSAEKIEEEIKVPQQIKRNGPGDGNIVPEFGQGPDTREREETFDDGGKNKKNKKNGTNDKDDKILGMSKSTLGIAGIVILGIFAVCGVGYYFMNKKEKAPRNKNE